MKLVIGVIVFFFIAMTFGAGISSMIFMAIIGGGAEQSFLYPIYGGIILLAGMIAICTKIVLEEITSLKEMIAENPQIKD